MRGAICAIFMIAFRVGLEWVREPHANLPECSRHVVGLHRASGVGLAGSVLRVPPSFSQREIALAYCLASSRASLLFAVTVNIRLLSPRSQFSLMRVAVVLSSPSL